MLTRQEVAEKLRETARTFDKEYPNGAKDWLDENAAFNTVDEIIGTDNNIPYAPFFSRLADLIDPTCHVTDEEVTHEPTLNALAVHVYGCDSCGWYFYMAEVCCHPKPFYCPMCGARVVRDEA